MITVNIIRYSVRLIIGLILFVASASALTFKNETGYPVNISWCYDYSLKIRFQNSDLIKQVVNNNDEFEVPGSNLKSYYPIMKSVNFEVKINGQYKVCFAFDAKELTQFSYSLKLGRCNSTIFEADDYDATQEWNLFLLAKKDDKKCKSGVFQIVRVQKIN